MGVYHIKQKLITLLPGTTGLIMQYQDGGRREHYTATVGGKNFSVTVEPQSTEDAIVAAILDGVKKQEEISNGAANDLQPGTGGPNPQ